MNFKTLLAMSFFALSSTSAMASMTTPQTLSYSSSAGVVTPAFTFDKFDTMFNQTDGSYRELTNVYFKTFFAVDNGMVGADNITNQAISGLAHLGANISNISSSEAFFDANYLPMFTQQELIQYASFSLDADPTLSVGGNGTDVAVYNGVHDEVATNWKALNTDFLGSYISDNVSDTTFDINYNMNSDIYVGFTGGVQGLFQSVDGTFSVSVQYEYNLVTPPANSVPAPIGMAIGAFGLLAFGVAKRKTKVK